MAPKKRQQQQQRSAPKIDPNSSFTPENFEKELKALALKAKQETWAKAFTSQTSVYAKALPLLSLAAVYANVSQLNLSPVYGAIPASIWHSAVVMAACFVGWSSNLYLRRLLGFYPVILLPVWAAYIPVAQFYLFQHSVFLTAHYGPAITEALTLFPLVAVSVACVATLLEDADFSRLPRWLGDSLPGLSSWAAYKIAESSSERLLQTNIGQNFFQTRLGYQMILSASYALLAPSRLLLLTIPALIHTTFYNTHVASPMALQSLNETMVSSGWMILERRESITGYVSVVESLDMNFRVMRCDHSLLGGEWTNYRVDPVAEPIYGVFVMLEAVRLVETPDRLPDTEASALVM